MPYYLHDAYDRHPGGIVQNLDAGRSHLVTAHTNSANRRDEPAQFDKHGSRVAVT
jgi:hypothetical protein